jgi:hypothetical protein
MFEPFPPKESLASRIRSKKGVSSDQINQVIFRYPLSVYNRLTEVTFTGIIVLYSPKISPMQLRYLDRVLSMDRGQGIQQLKIPLTSLSSSTEIIPSARTFQNSRQQVTQVGNRLDHLNGLGIYGEMEVFGCLILLDMLMGI